MSVQFQLGHVDHKVIEDFLNRSPLATSAITLHPKFAGRQERAAEAARDRGISVFFEPATERLAHGGYNMDGFPIWSGAPYDVDILSSDIDVRAALVAKTIEAHPDGVTHITAPHFFVDNVRVARLNIDLAEMTSLQVESLPTRAVLTVSNKFAKQYAEEMAGKYVQAGVAELELRLSPFGGEDQSLKQIRDGFAVAKAFTDAGLVVTLGQSGNLGEFAVALGHAQAYSVGVGLLERVNHASRIRRQKLPPRKPAEDSKGGGPVCGVYLPGLAFTAPRRIAQAILEQPDLRTHVGCREGRCATSVRGPLMDSRDHYLHSRDSQMEQLRRQPATWRANSEIQRLRSALGLREHVNAHYVGRDRPLARPLPTRTLTSLISDTEFLRRAS